MATEVNTQTQTQTQTVVTLRPPSPAVQDVRLKFFTSLGFDTQQQQQQSAGAPTNSNQYYGRSHSGNMMNHTHPHPHPQQGYNPYCIDENNTSWAQRIQNVNTFQEELKWDPHDQEQFYRKPRAGAITEAPATTTTTQKNTNNNYIRKKKKKSLSFHETVEVVPIPMRNEYSNRVKARLWSNAMELQENAARNSMEFAHEGWNWRNVLEDEHMYVCVATGELVHPSHYQMFESHGFR